MLGRPRKNNIKAGTKSRNTDYVTKKSKYNDAVLAIVLNPENWKFTVAEISQAAGDLLRKFDRKATNPCYSTVVRVMKHPEFQERLKEYRKQFLIRALPAMEHALVKHIIENGDVKAFDRIMRLMGEGEGSKVDESQTISDDKLKDLVKKIINRK